LGTISITNLAQRIPLMQPTASCGEAVRRFTAEPETRVIPVGTDGKVRSLLDRHTFLGAFAGRYSWSLLYERPLEQWLRTQTESTPVFTISGNADVAEAAEMLQQQPAAGGVLIVLVHGLYHGVLTQESVLTGMMTALSKARDDALAASEAKSMFLATMSHEIRTPLTGILGLSEVLLEDRLDPQRQELVELIHSSGRNLLDLINNILDLSRLEVGKLALDEQPFDLVTSVREIIALLAIHAQRKGLELHLRIKPGVPEVVVGDPLRLRQVLTNLVGNALKFTEVGRVELTLWCESGQEILFTISDTGPGMSPLTQSHLFQPFVQGDGSPSRRHEGSGLGLAISHRLVSLMRGSLSVESRLGQGSQFQVRLPFRYPQTLQSR
jgi:signal transduction histidine kinase